jgi:hypothetical protein
MVSFTFAPALQLLKHMLDVNPVGNELRASLGHSPQESFPVFVDERHITKVDNAGSLVVASARPRPGISQLTDRRPDQAPSDDPFTFR